MNNSFVLFCWIFRYIYNQKDMLKKLILCPICNFPIVIIFFILHWQNFRRPNVLNVLRP